MMVLGIDIGGSGVKGAPVDPVLGELTAERRRVPTPQPSDVTSVLKAAQEVAGHFDTPDRVVTGAHVAPPQTEDPASGDAQPAGSSGGAPAA